MEGAIGQVAAEGVVSAGKGIFSCLKLKCDYVKNLSKNFKELEKKSEQLYDKETDVKKVLVNNVRRMEMTQGCETWLNEVKEKKVELEKLEKRYKDTYKCLCGMCPFFSLLKLGKDIVKETRQVEDLRGRMHLPNDIMIDRAPELPASPVRAIKKRPKKIDDVPSLNDHVETLIDWLKDKNLKRICIWGLPGVGKTTVMENLNDKMSETRLFEIIIFIDVSKERTVRKRQKILAERLDLKVEGIRNSDRIADMISTALANKRYLLLLDEVFVKINLEELGINNDHEHGKVVFASRYRDISESDEEIRIERLSKDDALKMFREMVGNIIDDPPIKPIAELVLQECSGLPQAIKLIAPRLKDKDDPALWRSTKYKLQSPCQNQEKDLETLRKAFELVYDQLSDDQQRCLLYWAFFPAEYEIYEDYLIECWRAEELMSHTQKLGKARDVGHGILEEFVEKSLLERGRKVGQFKMPVFFQRKALDMARTNEKSCRFLVGVGEEEEKPLTEVWENVKRVSLVHQQLITLPERPRCSEISTLLLQKNASLTVIPESFFEYMCGLRVLDLYDTKITSLPSSICKLMNLRVLYLNKCSLVVKLPSEIEGLKRLEILDIRGTGIHTLPEEIRQLPGLKCLRVSFKENVVNENHFAGQPGVMIPCNVIASLSLLEELSIDVSPNCKSWNQIVYAIAKEVASLEELTSLCFYFPSMNCFETFIDNSISWKRNNPMNKGFRSFRILIGSHMADTPRVFNVFGDSTERHLRFSSGEGTSSIAISEVLNYSSTFELIHHQTAKHLSDFGVDGLKGLKTCIIKECNKMESIIVGNPTTDVAFKFLKKLHITNLPKLKCIWEGSVGAESLTWLTNLTLKGCPEVKVLFSQGMVQNLSKLEDLQVEDCGGIVEVIETGSAVDIGAFPKLKNLGLCNLPRLSSISSGLSLEWPSLEKIVIKTCGELKNLPSSMENPTKLRMIKCTSEWWNQLDWPNVDVKNRFENLPSFI